MFKITETEFSIHVSRVYNRLTAEINTYEKNQNIVSANSSDENTTSILNDVLLGEIVALNLKSEDGIITDSDVVETIFNTLRISLLRIVEYNNTKNELVINALDDKDEEFENWKSKYDEKVRKLNGRINNECKYAAKLCARILNVLGNLGKSGVTMPFDIGDERTNPFIDINKSIKKYRKSLDSISAGELMPLQRFYLWCRFFQCELYPIIKDYTNGEKATSNEIDMYEDDFINAISRYTNESTDLDYGSDIIKTIFRNINISIQRILKYEQLRKRSILKGLEEEMTKARCEELNAEEEQAITHLQDEYRHMFSLLNSCINVLGNLIPSLDEISEVSEKTQHNHS